MYLRTHELPKGHLCIIIHTAGDIGWGKSTSCPNICIKANGRFPVKLGSDRRETLPERVSNDFGRLNFRRQKFFFGENFERKFLFFCQFGVDFDELQRNGRQNQLPGQILLQIDLS